MKFLSPTGAILAMLALVGCAPLNISHIADTSASDIDPIGPPDAEPGACYGKEILPAVIETATEHVLTRAATYADDGSLLTPAAYQTERLQKIVSERADVWFKVPCDAQKIDAFDASLQRALKVRGYYKGPITGALGPKTRQAIRRYQQDHGLSSSKLSLKSARALGLSAVPRDNS